MKTVSIMKQLDLEREKIHLGIIFITLLIPLVLYLGRELDDNRLTSWSWVFKAASPGCLWLILAALSPLLWIMARSSLPAMRHPLVPSLFAFAVGLMFVEVPEVIVDASRYFAQAKFVKEHGVVGFIREWGGEIFVWTDLPLIPFFYGLLFTIFGELRLAAQFGNLVFFALSVYLIRLLGSDLWDEETGILAAFMLLGFPFLYTQVPLLLVDVGTMTMLILAMLTWYRALVRGGLWRLLLAAAVLATAVLVKYSAWLLLLAGLGPLLVVAMVDVRGHSPLVVDWSVTSSYSACWRVGRRGLLIGIIALFLLTPWLIVHWESMAAQMKLLAIYQRPGLKRWGESLFSTFLFQTHPLLTAGALYAAFLAWSRRDGRFLAIAFLPLLILVFMEVRRIRYTLPIFPLIALLAAYGFRSVADPQVRRHLVLAVVVPSLILAWGVFRPFLLGMGERNLQEAGAYLDRLGIERAMVLVLATSEPVLDSRVSIPLLDLFTGKQLYYYPWPLPERPVWVTTSPLRFTWEFSVPAFYIHKDNDVPEAVVVISDTIHPKLPPPVAASLASLPEKKEFARINEVFLHRTFVTVYHRATWLP